MKGEVYNSLKEVNALRNYVSTVGFCSHERMLSKDMPAKDVWDAQGDLQNTVTSLRISSTDPPFDWAYLNRNFNITDSLYITYPTK